MMKKVLAFVLIISTSNILLSQTLPTNFKQALYYTQCATGSVSGCSQAAISKGKKILKSAQSVGLKALGTGAVIGAGVVGQSYFSQKPAVATSNQNLNNQQTDITKEVNSLVNYLEKITKETIDLKNRSHTSRRKFMDKYTNITESKKVQDYYQQYIMPDIEYLQYVSTDKNVHTLILKVVNAQEELESTIRKIILGQL